MHRTRSDRPGDETDGGSTPPPTEWSGDGRDDEQSVPCAACGDDATHTFVLTVDWVDDLVDAARLEWSGDVCRTQLCARCHSWGEMIEIAELGVEDRGPDTRDRVADERDRFLDELDVRRIEGVDLAAAAGELP